MTRIKDWMDEFRNAPASEGLGIARTLVLSAVVGMVAGLFFGLSFGMGGVGAAVLGELADSYGIELVYTVCSFLPLMGLLAIFLPNLKPLDKERTS